MKRFLNIKCSDCCFLNRIEVDKISIEQLNPKEPQVRALIPVYEQLETERIGNEENL